MNLTYIAMNIHKQFQKLINQIYKLIHFYSEQNNVE